jgi:hypothetical protein
MRAPILLGLIIMLQSTGGLCADLSAWFPGLTRLELKQERVRVWYPKSSAHAVTSPPAYLKEYEQAGVYAAEPLLLDLGHGLPKLALACDSGPSNDPSCRLLTKFDDPASAIFESAGNDFVFLASGEIRVFGNTDQLYDHRRLFRFDGKRFNEVAQPFRYVGIEGKRRRSIEGAARAVADHICTLAGEDDDNESMQTRRGADGHARARYAAITIACSTLPTRKSRDETRTECRLRNKSGQFRIDAAMPSASSGWATCQARIADATETADAETDR